LRAASAAAGLQFVQQFDAPLVAAAFLREVELAATPAQLHSSPSRTEPPDPVI
jgi:hypothetical protein